MERSTARLPDPDEQLPYVERRRIVRQKLHTPVYVSFNTPQSGAVVDLSELLDLNESGFAVQTALPAAFHNTALPSGDRLEVSHAVTLCLDLPETRQFVHGSGQVMWTDDTGRAGIRFSFLPDSSRQVLKEWLFANLLVASTNHAARTGQLAHQQELRARDLAVAEPAVEQAALEPESEPIPIRTPSRAVELGTVDSRRAQLLSALDDVRRQIRAIEAGAIDGGIGADSGAVLSFITERAAGFTGASGAALALLTGDKIVCRASAGEPAPPVGSEVDAQNGLSGECLRYGTVVSCADTESDPRVDPEVCRMFGIGSFMAAPIFAESRVAGLVEVFSPYPHTFTQLHEIVLERLAELVPGVQNKHINKKQIEVREVETREIENDSAARVLPEIAATEQPTDQVNKRTETEPEETRQTAVDQSGVVEPVPKRISESSSERTPERTSERASEPSLEQHFDDVADGSLSSARRFPLSHLVLLVMAIAVAAMALGYLLAPTIEQHWLRRAQAAPSSSSSAGSLTGAPDRRGHALSPTELRQLAESGDADAQWQLGILYHDGDTVPQSDALAVQWFQRAAEQGYARAQSTLGAYYWAGRGVAPDSSKAYFWSLLALAHGDQDSKSRLEGLSAQMTQAQVASARQQAEAWLRAHNQGANSQAN